MKTLYALSLIALFLSLTPLSARADILHYVDDSGKVHYVDSPTRIPQRFRAQANSNKPLPPISKLPPSRYVGTSNRAPLPYPVARKTVEIFVTSWCPYCKKLEAFLQGKNIKYTRWDIEKSDQGRHMYQQLGGAGIPVTKVGSQVIRGFNPDQISQSLGM